MSGETISVELDRELATIYLRGKDEALPRMIEAVAHIDWVIQQALEATKKKPAGKKKRRSQ